MFPPDLLQGAFTLSNGDIGWRRYQVPRVVAVLVDHQRAILGGELWWVPLGADTFELVPQSDGTRACYTWETRERPADPWPDFVRRCAGETLAAVEKWPLRGDIPANLQGQVLYQLTWTPDEKN